MPANGRWDLIRRLKVKLPSTCFEQIIVHNQDVISVHAAYGILPCIYGVSSRNHFMFAARHPVDA